MRSPCPSHQQELRDCRYISTWEPRPCPEGSQKVSQNPCSEDASKSTILLNRKRSGVYLEVWQADLLVGFMADFWAWLADFGGTVRWRIFCFRLADFPADLFGGFFFGILRPKKSTVKSTTSMAVFWLIFHRSLNPRPAVSKFQV